MREDGDTVGRKKFNNVQDMSIYIYIYIYIYI